MTGQKARVWLAAASVGALLAAEASAQGLPLPSDVRHEPATDAVWMRARGGLAEWEVGGAINFYYDAFNPFRFRDPRSFNGTDNSSLIAYEGQFAILSNSRGVYRRNASGQFHLEDPFAAPGALGCDETPATNACTFAATMDAGGREVISVFRGNETVSKRIWTGSEYRALNAREEEIEAEGVDLAFLSWNAAGTVGIARTFGGSSSSMPYLLATPERILRRSVTFSDPTRVVSPSALVSAGDGFALTAYVFSSDSMVEGYEFQVFELRNPENEVPELVHRATLPVSLYDTGLSHLGFDDTHAYVSTSVNLYAIPLFSGSSDNSPMFTCTEPQRLVAAQVADRRSKLHVACGSSLLKIEAGVVTREIVASGAVVQGSILSDQDGAYDVVLSLSDGRIERLRENRPRMLARTSALPFVPSYLSLKWEEPGAICGLASGIGNDKVLCRTDGRGWELTDLGIGIEGDRVVRFDLATSQRTSTDAPRKLSNGAAAYDGWLCDDAGLWSLDNGNWNLALPSCLRSHATEGGVAATDGQRLHLCRDGSCDAGVPLPKPYLDDTIIGTEADGRVVVAMGAELFARTDDGSFVDRTPRYASGSLMLTPASRIDAGVMTLRGAGVVVLSNSNRSMPLHVRVD